MTVIVVMATAVKLSDCVSGGREGGREGRRKGRRVGSGTEYL